MEVKRQRGDQIEDGAAAAAVVTVVDFRQEAAVGVLNSHTSDLVMTRRTLQLSLRISQKTNTKTR
jgi:hypothetical protein